MDYMHLIVDIRDAHPLSSFTERYGESWGKLWQKYHPHDSLTFLILDTQIVKWENYVQVPRGPDAWWRKRNLIASKGNEVFRCVNFSLYAPYDRHVPTLTHIFHNRAWLYPNEWETGYIARKTLEYRMHRTIRDSIKIIVPSMSTGLECVELWWVKESDIEIIPYIPLSKWEIDELTGTHFQIDDSFFLYDGSFWSEGNIISILKGFESYRYLYGGTAKLIMHGSPGHELSNVTQMIRAFDLTEHVKIVGVLEWPKYEWLYANANAWIMLGSYYSGGPRVEYAHTHGLPMILSDVASVRHYGSKLIHPNHVAEELPPLLKSLESKKDHVQKEREYSEHDIIKVYENYLSYTKR